MNAAGVRKPAPKLGRLDALKLTEPVRFYLWPAVAVQAVVLLLQVVAAIVTGEWSLFLAAQAVGVLAVLLATGAARASAWTIPGIQAAFRDAERDRG